MPREIRVPSGGKEIVFTATVNPAKDHTDSRGTFIRPSITLAATVTIRGIEYSATVTAEWTETDWPVYRAGVDTGATTRWHIPAGYRTYRRVSNGKTPEWRTAAHNQLDTIVSDALVSVERQWPEWKTQSLAARLAAYIDTARAEAARLRREAAELDAQVAAHRRELDAICSLNAANVHSEPYCVNDPIAVVDGVCECGAIIDGSDA